MDSARFAALADAFGGALRRWPKAERVSAWLYAVRHPNCARRILKAAGLIDRFLGESAAPVYNPALADRIERIFAGRNFRPTLDARPLRRRLGAGLAIAAATGAVAGFAITPLAIRSAPAFDTADPVADATTALGEPNELGET